MRMIGVIILSMFLSLGAARADEGIVVSTDKPLYHAGQEMTVTLVNPGPQDVYALLFSMFIESVEKKDEKGQWQAFEVRCTWPECDIDADGPTMLGAGQDKTFTWTTVRHDKLLRQDLSLEPGTYRLVGGYQYRPAGSAAKDWAWLSARSNEFEIVK